VAAAIEFAREFKVMEDAEDGLDDLHEFGGARALLSLARARAALVARVYAGMRRGGHSASNGDNSLEGRMTECKSAR